MRVMMIVKATKESDEAGEMPSTELLAAMGQYNEELVKAGVMQAGEGLHPSSRGKQVRFSGASRTVTDGPFCRDEAADRRLLAVAGRFDRRGRGLGQALPQSHDERFRHRDPARFRGR